MVPWFEICGGGKNQNIKKQTNILIFCGFFLLIYWSILDMYAHLRGFWVSEYYGNKFSIFHFDKIVKLLKNKNQWNSAKSNKLPKTGWKLSDLYMLVFFGQQFNLIGLIFFFNALTWKHPIAKRANAANTEITAYTANEIYTANAANAVNAVNTASTTNTVIIHPKTRWDRPVDFYFYFFLL